MGKHIFLNDFSKNVFVWLFFDDFFQNKYLLFI